VNSDKRQFQINMPGLLKVLAEHLYSNRKVAIRELLQNAHDSIIRRQLASDAPPPYIKVHINRAAHMISIQDNGAGMTDQDIITYLTTIGNSYTREFSSSLEFDQPEQASKLIGQFGLGFLSAFLIASEVRLRTLAQDSVQGWRWFCNASEYYEMAPDSFSTVGTLIEIKLKPEAEFLLDENTLSASIRQYADFLSVPIYLNDNPVPVNLMTPPWEAADKEQAAVDFIGRNFRQNRPIHIIELHDQVVDLGHDIIVIPLSGFVFVPPSSVISLHEYGDLTVYIRRMFITDQDRSLLPSWAKFFRGVVDSPMLQPTASRESIHQEENYLAVQQALETQILQGLRTVATEKPDVWRQIVINHTDLVLGWVTVNQEFFEQVADLLPLRTSRGAMALPEYLKQTDHTLFFVTQQIGSLQEQLLGEGYEVPVIDASWFAVVPFLEKFAHRRGNIKLVQLDGDARRLMRPVEDSRYDGLLAYFRKHKINARISAYKPHNVPALMLYPRNADTLIEARRALDSNELSSPFAALISDYINRQTEDEESDPAGVLYLNASCPLINRLVDMSVDSREAVLALLYQVARLFAARTLAPQDATKAFASVCTSIEEMLNHG
jgi:molecular chaperone HtpG